MGQCYLTMSDGAVLPNNVRWVSATYQCPMGQCYLTKSDGSMLPNNVRRLSAT